MNAAPTTAFEPLFSYGQTRERYQLPAGTPPMPYRALEQLVRRDPLPALCQALLQDRGQLAGIRTGFGELAVSPLTRQCLWELQSGIFLRLLENVSGLSCLLPDSHGHCLGLHDPGMPLSFTQWQEPATGLPVAAYLCIGLHSGDGALLGPAAETLLPAEPMLAVAYLAYHGESA